MQESRTRKGCGGDPEEDVLDFLPVQTWIWRRPWMCTLMASCFLGRVRGEDSSILVAVPVDHHANAPATPVLNTARGGVFRTGKSTIHVRSTRHSQCGVSQEDELTTARAGFRVWRPATSVVRQIVSISRMSSPWFCHHGSSIFLRCGVMSLRQIVSVPVLRC